MSSLLEKYNAVALFCFSYLYQIAHLGDEDDEPEFSSAMPLEEGDTFFFAPRQLKNLVMVDELHSFAPILGCQVADLANEDTPQLYLLCGRGPRSSLRVLRHGLEVSEMAVSELPGNPNAVWTVKKRIDGETHQTDKEEKPIFNKYSPTDSQMNSTHTLLCRSSTPLWCSALAIRWKK